MLKSIGRLIYEPGFRLIVLVDKGLADFYRSLIPKSLPVQKPRWAPHITVVRSEKETPAHPEHWSKYEGKEVEFCYDPFIRIDKTYYWLNTWCDRLVEIRTELGLPAKSRWTRPPDGHQCFHITIANRKY